MIKVEALEIGACRGRVPALVALFNLVWGGMTAEYWIWKHLQNPLLEAAPTVAAWDRGRLVGAVSFMPVQYLVGGRRQRAVQRCDAMVHPDYRGRGIYTRLMAVAQEYYKNAGYSFMIGFPNAQSFPALVKMGGRHLFDLNSFLLFQNSYPFLKRRLPGPLARAGRVILDGYPPVRQRLARLAPGEGAGLEVRIHGQCPPAVPEIGEKIPPCMNRLHLSRQYLDWRLDSKPGAGYRYIVVGQEGQPAGYCILALPPSSREQKIARLVDLEAFRDEPRVIAALVGTAIKYLQDKADALRVPFFNQSRPYEQVLKQYGFLATTGRPAGNRKTPLVVILLDGSLGDEMKNKEDWKISLLDSDTA